MQDAKRRAKIFAVLSVVLAILAGFLFLQKVNQVDASMGQTVTVYVAEQSITSREPLKKEYFAAKEIPVKYVQELGSVVTKIDNIEKMVTITPLQKGEVLTENNLKPVSGLTSSNNRMVTLAENDRVMFDGGIEANDRVDIIVSTDEGGNKTTQIFMSDVRVVGVSEDKKTKRVEALGLEVPLKKARELIHAQNFAVAIRVLKAPQEEDVGSQNQGNSSTQGGAMNSNDGSTGQDNKQP
ncbi:Flp pilus assembly protein CpaB [Melghirimyces profundicolus]|uniref:Flp pilus assembly protein CpaB n=1 Tax=Melghirimyces profundicolus TaxID=1242148 RepID=A0A2T6BGU1_9BACL|nr:Flp pilus assembly protein CpaB [Melghirimyces profundicolus]PTX55270.1 Flp pilus assembly protein CpaB [Melghirimyces profundicolus]